MKQLTYNQWLFKHEGYKKNGWRLMAVTPPKEVYKDMYEVEVEYIKDFHGKNYHTRNMTRNILISGDMMEIRFMQSFYSLNPTKKNKGEI